MENEEKEASTSTRILALLALIANFAIFFYLRDSPDLTSERWGETLYKKFSEDELIGQLFMVAAYSKADKRHYSERHQEELEALIKRYNIGGLIFYEGDSESQVRLTNRYQKLSKIRLFIAMDAEWGLGMRLSDGMSFPKQMTLGAVQDIPPLYFMGAEIGRQLRRIGVNISFAPVLDINSNPENPVIGQRSFGDIKERVARHGVMYMDGLRYRKILPVVKHFPGHGDTSEDSHKTLPIVTHSRERIEQVELFPFKEAIKAGMPAVMSAHLLVPAYDDTVTSLSHKVTTGLLKNELGYKGLIFTDALNMKAITQHYGPEEAVLRALEAGNDILILPEDVPKAIEAIKKAIAEKRISREAVNEKIKRVLTQKYNMGFYRWFWPISTENLAEELHLPHVQDLRKQLFEQAITVVRNWDSLLPLQNTEGQKIASLSIISQAAAKQLKKHSEAAGSDNTQESNPLITPFATQLKQHTSIDNYTLVRDTITQTQVDELRKTLSGYPVVIVSIHNIKNKRSQRFGFTQEELQLLQTLEQHTPLVVIPFGNAYSLEYLASHKHLIAPYEDNEVTVEAVAKIIFGVSPSCGKLPISIPGAFPSETGVIL